MRTIWHSLAWKEWHEHKWKVAAITAVLCGVAALVLCGGDERDVFGLAMVFITISVIPLSIFVGSGAAAGEQSRRTLPFLQALPAPMWRASLTKLAFGLFTLALSVLLTVAVTYVAANAARAVGFNYAAATSEYEKDSLSGHWYVDYVLICASIAASFFIWSSAAGVNRKDEVSAGAVALLAMVGWCVVLFVAFCVVFLQNGAPRRDEIHSWLFVLGLSTAPAGFVPAALNAHEQSHFFLPLVVLPALITHLALSIWYIKKFGRLSNLGVTSPQVAARDATRADWLGPPRRSAWSAIAWKQFRESGPIALAALAGSIGITTFVLLFNDPYQLANVDLLGQVFTKMSVFLGFFVALVAGIGICLNDVTPAANTFWRSRPIQPDMWFGTKFVTGLLVVLISIYVPIGLLGAMHIPVFNNWNFPDAYLAPLIHLAVFASAAATTCLIRQAVYSAILSIAAVYVGTVTGIAISLLAGVMHLAPLARDRWWEPTVPQIGFGLLLSFFASTILAWLAVRYDWGKKSRY